MPNVSLIIPNWNGRDHLEVCLTSILRQSLRPVETVLVDNGSSDDSVALVRERFPWVRCIAMGLNAGFAAAVNRGITETSGEFVALLNNDTELDAAWLGVLTARLADDPRAGLAACKMLRFDRRGIIDGAGDAMTRAGAPYTRGAGEPDGPRFNATEYVFGACAGAALYRRKMFEEIGLFDEDFVSYYEDVDLSLRALLAGWRCVYVPAALCYHKRGASSARMPGFPIRMQERNLTALYVKNFPAQVLMMRGPVILASRLRRTWRAVVAGLGGPTLLGLAAGIALIPRMLTKRKQIQQRRIVSAADVKYWMGR